MTKQKPMKTAFAIRHVHFEGVGSLQSALIEHGYNLTYWDLGIDDLFDLETSQPDLLVVLGGPVGVYEDDLYPFLARERRIVADRLQRNLPTLGICLGAQQIAYALGVHVGPSGYKEIGFAPVTLTLEGKAGPLRHLEGVDVLHWHGDMFQIPETADRLAETSLCRNQAFAIGRNVLALQFHPEVNDAANIEAWLVGHAAELSAAKVDPRVIRSESNRCITPLSLAAQKMFADWLEQLDYTE